jgi:hypothetical protein
MVYTPFLMFTQSDLILPVDYSHVLIGCLRRTREAAPNIGLVHAAQEAEAGQHGEGVADCGFQHGCAPFFGTDELFC